VGILTDEDLLAFYRDLFSDGLHEKYFTELIDGSRITECAITPQSQIELGVFLGEFFEKLTQHVESVSLGKASLDIVSSTYPSLLTNAFCNPTLAKLLGLKRTRGFPRRRKIAQRS